MHYQIKHIAFLFIAGLLLYGCNSSSKEDKNEKKQSENLTKTENQKMEKLFYFFLTTDSTCCDPDAIAPTDCGDGFIYLTAKGNVIFKFNCMDENGKMQEKYDIGTFKNSENGISMTFNQSYNYNKGEIVTHDDDDLVFHLDLVNKNCNGVLYYFTEDRPEFKYAVIEANDNRRKDFFESYTRHDKLKEL